MPSNRELDEFMEAHPTVRVLNTGLGEMPVVPFYDVVDALERAREEPQDGDDFWPSRVRHAERRGYQRALAAAVAAIRKRGGYHSSEEFAQLIEQVAAINGVSNDW